VNDEYALIVVDATYVPKCKASVPITLTGAPEVHQGPVVQDRTTLNRDVVSLDTGAEENIKSMLEVPSIQAVMHEGN